jgi:glycosyltransferase involved in cell wall biosynthesis
MNSALVSIIIPTYNRAHLISETLDSVLAQTYENWECIIVDDGSKDNTADLLQNYCIKDKRFLFYKRTVDRPKGANACRNYGFELSKGEYVNWFDDDDIMHPNKLIIQVKALQNSNYNFSVCQTLIFENTIKNLIGLRSKKIYSENVFYDYLTQKIVWLTPSSLWKKKFLKTFKYLFDEELQAAQEWEFHCRVLLSCKDYNVINDALIYIRQHENSVTYNSDEKKRMWNYFLARNKLYKRHKIKLNTEEVEFLQDYLLSNFKKYVRSYSLKNSFKSFYLYVFSEKKFNSKLKFYAFIGVVSYLMTHKGHVFLKKVKYIR